MTFAALPPHTAESLRLSVTASSVSEATPQRGGAASSGFRKDLSESRRLSAMCYGKAVKTLWSTKNPPRFLATAELVLKAWAAERKSGKLAGQWNREVSSRPLKLQSRNKTSVYDPSAHADGTNFIRTTPSLTVGLLTRSTARYRSRY
jgi:hypothetical protein